MLHFHSLLFYYLNILKTVRTVSLEKIEGYDMILAILSNPVVVNEKSYNQITRDCAQWLYYSYCLVRTLMTALS